MKLINVQNIKDFLGVIVIIVLHFFLIRYMADRNIVSSLLAAGEHIPKTVAITAMFFLLIRIFMYVFLPGFVLYRLCIFVMNDSTDTKIITRNSDSIPEDDKI